MADGVGGAASAAVGSSASASSSAASPSTAKALSANDFPEAAVREVSPDPADATGKHALKRRWTLLHGKPASKEPREWRRTLTEIRTVSTVEDLVLALAALESPASLVGRVEGQQLFLFQEGARPDWKDPLVKSKGGRWDLPLRYSEEAARAVVGAEEETKAEVDTDSMWLKLLLQVAGESLPHSEDVVGVAVERKADRSSGDPRASSPAWMLRVSLWVQTGADLEKQLEIGCALRDTLRLPEESIAFCSFRREDRESNPKITI